MGSFWWRPSGPLATSRRVQPSLYTYTKKIQFHIWDHAEHICYQKRCRSKYLHPTGQNDLLAFRIEQIRNDIVTNYDKSTDLEHQVRLSFISSSEVPGSNPIRIV